MRVALIGGYFHDDGHRMRRFVQASTELTHTDPKANVGALAIAQLAAWGVEHDSSQPPEAEVLLNLLSSLAPEDEDWQALVEGVRNAYLAGRSVPEYAASIGLAKGVSGYVYHTVPVAVYAWLRHYGDFRKTVEGALDCGGDTDTVGAIAGALAGATTGAAGIPAEWLGGICDVPRSVALLRRVAERLAEQRLHRRALGAVHYCWPLILPRNLLFLAVVLVHGFRRLLPPY